MGNNNKSNAPPLTMLSLFDGSGGFPQAGLMCGIEPVFASEVEPFAIRVTTKRLPQMTHLGDINKINGAEIPPADLVTGGSCCQGLSVSGLRRGLVNDPRSNLFSQMTRIIREMMAASNNEYPRFLCFENVCGLLSSQKGNDFKIFMNEIAELGFIADPAILDASAFGVAQRRRRVYIACINRNYFRPELLFGLSGDYKHGRAMDKALANWGGEVFGGITSRPHEVKKQKLAEILQSNVDAKFYLSALACTGILRRVDNRGKKIPDLLRLALETQAGIEPTVMIPKSAPIAFEPGACRRLGGHAWADATGTLRAHYGDCQLSVALDENAAIQKDSVVPAVYDARGNGDGQTVGTITGDHENRVTDYTSVILEENKPMFPQDVITAAFMGGQGEKAGSIAYSESVSPTLKGSAGGNSVPMVMTAYGFCSDASNAMRGPNENVGIYEAETSKTIDTSGLPPQKNQGGMAVLCVEQNFTRPTHQGNGVNEDVSFTLNCVEKNFICYQDQVGTLAASDYKFPQNQQIDEDKAIVERVTFGNNGYGRWNDQPATLKNCGGDMPGGENLVVENRSRYVVRRLTPQECAMLQGFEAAYCTNLGEENPSEDDIKFWTDVWETHRLSVGASSRPKSRSAILKWLKDPYSASAEYKLWGNGIALPCAVFVMEGIVDYWRRYWDE